MVGGGKKQTKQKEQLVQKTSEKKQLDHPAPEAGAEYVRGIKHDWRGRERPHVTGQEKPKETLVFS